jgi:putative transcriptional regulator
MPAAWRRAWTAWKCRKPSSAFIINKQRPAKAGFCFCGRRKRYNMRMQHARDSLQNHLLIAMPAMDDPNFSGTVSLICQHDENGAMGFVLNRPIETTVSDVMDQLKISIENPQSSKGAVFLGGPVHAERGFILYCADEVIGQSLEIAHDLRVSASREALEELAKATNRMHKHRMYLGYAGWEAGQLEQEIAENAWLTVPANRAIIFDTAPENLWNAAVKSLGFDASSLSGTAGRA